MTEAIYALIGVIVTAAIAYALIGWTKGTKPRTSVDQIKPNGEDTH